MNYLSIWVYGGIGLSDGHDYYEPRAEGRYFITKKTNGITIGFSSDYRKSLALDGEIGWYETPDFNSFFKGIEISPIVRVSNHFSFRYTFNIDNQENDKGFALLQDDSVIFGNRNINTITNSFSSNYILKNDLSLSIRFRHYWSTGEYENYLLLEQNGDLSQLPANTDYGQNFNFNSFNIDLVFNWQFAPGSNLSIVWKKEILSESEVIIHSFGENFSNTFEQPQWNTFSIKAIYYLDYQYLKRKK
jgi:hypothetical protein